MPARVPRVAWRSGLDLNPLDVRNEDDVEWLETLIWPDQPDRLARFRAAVAIDEDFRAIDDDRPASAV